MAELREQLILMIHGAFCTFDADDHASPCPFHDEALAGAILALLPTATMEGDGDAAEVQRLGAGLKAENAELKTLLADSRSRCRALAALREENERRRVLLARREAALNVQDAEVTALRAELAGSEESRAADLAAATAVILERDEQVGALRAELDEYKDVTADHLEAIVSLRSQLADAEASRARLFTLVDATGRQLGKHVEKLAEAERVIANVRNYLAGQEHMEALLIAVEREKEYDHIAEAMLSGAGAVVAELTRLLPHPPERGATEASDGA